MTGLRLLQHLVGAAAFGEDAHMPVIDHPRHAVAVPMMSLLRSASPRQPCATA
jgi:hypothetical protein